MSLAAVVIAMSAMVACEPPMDAQVPQNGTGDGTADSAAVASSAQLSAAPPPPTEAECRVLASKPLPTPQGPVSDVKAQYDAFFSTQHDTFRCCFDALYAPKKPRTDGQVVLLVKVESSGKLQSSEIVKGETTADGPEFNACIMDVTKAIAYPKPANNATVGYKRTLQFKARR